METHKYISGNMNSAHLGKSIGVDSFQFPLGFPGLDLNQPSLIPSFNETRNIMSQFTTNASTVNNTANDFHDIINSNQNGFLKPQNLPPSFPANGIMNSFFADAAKLQATGNFMTSQTTPKPPDTQSISNSFQAVATQAPGTSDNPTSINTMPINHTNPHNVLIKQEADDKPAFTPTGSSLATAKLDPAQAYIIIPKSEAAVLPLAENTNVNKIDTNDESKHTCDICGKSYKDAVKLRTHKYTHAREKPFKCGVCSKGFDSDFKLQAHINIHGSDKVHHCGVCNKAFHSKTHVDRHMLIHNSEKPHKCSVCGKAFGRKEHLKRHELTHTGQKPHKCSLCPKSFRCKSNLLAHIHKHSDPDFGNTNDNNSNANQSMMTTEAPPLLNQGLPLMNQAPPLAMTQQATPTPVKQRKPRQQHHCALCNAVFNTKSSYNAHVLEHTGRKPYQCDKCDKCFNDKSSLCRHNMVHTGEKPYKCPRCEKTFARRDHLQRHTLTHTGEKPHQCKHCPKWFKLKRDLNAHLEGVHGEEIPEGRAKKNTEKTATHNSQASQSQQNPTPNSSQGQNSPVTMVSSPNMAVPGSNPINPQMPTFSGVSGSFPIPGQLPLPIAALPVTSLPMPIMPNNGQGQLLFNPINQLINQINMQQQNSGVASGFPAVNQIAPTNQMPIRPVATLAPPPPGSVVGFAPAPQVPISQSQMNNLFSQSNQFSLPAISSAVTPGQNNVAFPHAMKIPAYNPTLTPSYPPLPPHTMIKTETPTFALNNKPENGGGIPTSAFKQEAMTSTSGLQLPVVPTVTSAHLGYPAPPNQNGVSAGPNFTDEQKLLPTGNTDGNIYGMDHKFGGEIQKNNTDGDLYQLGQGYGLVKEENGGHFGSNDVDHSSLITNAMNSLNTIANCRLST